MQNGPFVLQCPAICVSFFVTKLSKNLVEYSIDLGCVVTEWKKKSNLISLCYRINKIYNKQNRTQRKTVKTGEQNRRTSDSSDVIVEEKNFWPAEKHTQKYYKRESQQLKKRNSVAFQWRRCSVSAILSRVVRYCVKGIAVEQNKFIEFKCFVDADTNFNKAI